MLDFMLVLLDAGHYDLLKYLMTAEEELGDQFGLGYTLGQYFEDIVVWEWQGDTLVYEDTSGLWHEVPDGVRTYVGFGQAPM